MNLPEVGQRIELVNMPDDPCPIEAGSLGTVELVTRLSDTAQVWVKWDNGRSLMMVIPPDEWRPAAEECDCPFSGCVNCYGRMSHSDLLRCNRDGDHRCSGCRGKESFCDFMEAR